MIGFYWAQRRVIYLFCTRLLKANMSVLNKNVPGNTGKYTEKSGWWAVDFERFCQFQKDSNIVMST